MTAMSGLLLRCKTLSTKVRIAQTSGKEVWFLDAVYVITATLAVICATCRQGLKEKALKITKLSASVSLC